MVERPGDTGLGERQAKTLARELSGGPVLREVSIASDPRLADGAGEGTLTETERPAAPTGPDAHTIPLADEEAARSSDRPIRALRAALVPPGDPDGVSDALPRERHGLRLMPAADALSGERWWKRGLYLVLAAGVVVLYARFLLTLTAPAHGGINQNAYLVGGKFLAESGTNGIRPPEPYYFLGWMWNLKEKPGADGKTEYWFYPKYPIGMNVIFAGVLKFAQWKDGTWDAGNFWHVSKWAMGSWDKGKLWAFNVNPIAMALAVGAMFMLLRRLTGSFAALLGMMILASCQMTLAYATHPLSHGPSLCAVTWGMYFVYRFWQTASWWRGILGGLLCGFAMTTRYTEGLLVIPIAAVMLSMVRYEPRSTRWWAMSVWLTLALAGLVVAYGTDKVPLDRWYTIAAIVLSGLVVGTVPILRGQLRRVTAEVAPGESESDVDIPDTRARRVARRLARVNWPAQFFHWLRVALAGALVWVVVRLELPHRSDWPDYVSGMVALVLFKTMAVGAIALLYLIPWTQPRRWLGTAWPALAWALPVGALLAFNWFTVRGFSGYDSTNESTAFTWRTFADKWDDTVQQIYDYSMFLVPPLALAGLVLMYRWSWRAGLFVTLWLIPGFALYTSYYYGKQRPGMWYLRFFLTVLPPMLMAAMWLLRSAFDGTRAGAAAVDGESPRRRWNGGSVAMPLALGMFAFASCAVGLSIAVPAMEREHATAVNLAYTCERIVDHVHRTQTFIDGRRAMPVVFAEGRNNPNSPLCNMLQWAVDAELYPSDGFTGSFDNWRGDSDPNRPDPLQLARQKYLTGVFKGKTDKDMIAEQNRIMSSALDSNRQVFAVLQPGMVNGFRKFITSGFEMKLIEQWREPARVGFERSSGPLDPAARGNPGTPLRAAQTWQLYEIRRKTPAATTPAATTPAPAPVTPPATKPAARAIVAASATQPAPQTAAPTTSPALIVVPVAAPATAPVATPAPAPAAKVATPAPAPSTAPAPAPAVVPSTAPVAAQAPTTVPAAPAATAPAGSR